MEKQIKQIKQVKLAIFMGAELIGPVSNDKSVIIFPKEVQFPAIMWNFDDAYLGTKNEFKISELRFDTSYEWQMILVKAIQNFISNDDWGHMADTGYYQALLDTIPYADKEEIFRVLCEFVDHYNKNY